MQEDWAALLLEKLQGPAWLISGDQWFGAYQPFESYEGNHPESFARFLSKLRATLVKNRKGRPSLVFASGDRHLSEIMKVKPFPGQDTFEITSSAIHAKTYPDAWREFPNRRQLVGASGVLNYSLVDSRVEKDGTLSLDVFAYGPESKVLYERALKVKPATIPSK